MNTMAVLGMSKKGKSSTKALCGGVGFIGYSPEYDVRLTEELTRRRVFGDAFCVGHPPALPLPTCVLVPSVLDLRLLVETAP